MYNNPTYPYQLPPPPPPAKKKISKRAKIIISIIIGVIALSLCSCIITSIASQSSASTAATPDATISAMGTVNASDSTQAAVQLTQVSKPIPTPKPTKHVATPRPTQPPARTGVNGNPWGYDFNSGNLIYSPPSSFCDYFNCIASFWNGSGFVNECNDGTYSKSGGHSGDCSRHGGEGQPLYSH